MSKVTVTESYLESIGDAIRNKLNTSQGYTPGQMAAAINSIPTGGITPTGTISITQNGTADVTQYASAAVNVPNSYAAGDEGKVVDNGVLVSQTGTTVTQNGTVDTTLNNEVVVNVPNSYTASDEGKVVQSGALVAQTSETVTQNGTYDTTTKDEVVVNVQGGVLNWNEPITTNWDYANVINTRGQSSYSASGYTSGVINGHNLYLAILDIVTGGLNLRQYTAGTTGYLIQRLKTDITNRLIGKQLTLSALVDDDIRYFSFTPTSAVGAIGNVDFGNDISISAFMQSGPQLEVNIAVMGSSPSVHLIQGIKLEFGDAQTLAKETNGTWSLIKNQNTDMEAIKGPLFTVTW